MPANDEDRLLEVLDDAECMRLLPTERVGRLGFTDAALPAILPVGFTVTDHSVCIPALAGDRVVAAARRSVVAFEVDRYDADTRTGWGVNVVGPAHVVPAGPAHVARDGSLSASSAPCTIVVPIGLLRGWRLTVPACVGTDGPTAGA